MNYAPEIIGVGKYTTELARFLAARRHSIEVVTALPHYPAWTVASHRPWRYETRREDAIRVTRCPLWAAPGGRWWRLMAPLTYAIAAAPIVLWRCLRFRPDVVLCIEPTLFAAPAALLAAWLAGARTVLHVQDLEVDAAFATGHLGHPMLRRIALACERALLRRFDAVVTISDTMASRLRARGLAANQVTVLRNWVDVARLAPALTSASLRAMIGVPDTVRMVLYAGNLGLKQGLPILIEAARHLRRHPDLRIVVAGDGPMAPVLRAAAASLPNLVLIGLQPAERLGALLAAADLHVLPQDRAAGDLVFPSKLGPLLASGKPIVVTADPWSELATWLGDAATLAPPGDGRALADVIWAKCQESPVQDRQQARTLVRSLDAAMILSQFERCLLGRDRPDFATSPLPVWPTEPQPAGLSSFG